MAPNDPAEKVSAFSQGYSVTPDDANDLPTKPTRGIYVGTGGNLVVTLAGDSSSITLTNVASGVYLPLNVARVHQTGTSADNIVALL